MADASIRKSELRNFLQTARSKDHHVYAFLAGLPKEHFYLLRFLVSKGPLKDRNQDDELRKYTVEEFLAHYDEFDPSRSERVLQAVWQGAVGIRMEANAATDRCYRSACAA